MSDALELVVLEKLVELSAEVEVQLTSQEHEPLKAILAHAREDAAEAIKQMLVVDPADANKVRHWQDRAWRYGNLVEWLREIVANGKYADIQVTEARAEEQRALILNVPEEMRIAMGLKEPGAGTE